MRYSSNKDLNLLVLDLVKHGAEVRFTGSGHLSIRLNGKTVVTSRTPSDHRSILNTRAAIRRIFGA